MSQPGLWSGLPKLFDSFGVFVVGRAGTDSEVALAGLKDYKNIWFVPQVLNDENSSTKIRFLLKNRMTVDYLTPRGVIEYIKENGLYVKD
jgi:nicotinamide mononucleotide adenylyltransferase